MSRPLLSMQNPKLLGRLETLPLYRVVKHDEETPREPDRVFSAPNMSTRMVEFKWNGRNCTGTQLHRAALDGNLAEVKRILDNNPEEVNFRFFYHTIYRKQPQEGSGQAIHLAASRGQVAVVELLMAFGASLHAMVTRDGKDHYDVMHAAVFAEGRNDNVEMVEYLSQRDAPIQANLDGLWPMHMAFRVGSLHTIKVLRAEMQRRGIEELEQMCTAVPSPLVLGIKMGRLTTTALAKAAAHTPRSLHTFIKYEPRCIPRFLKELSEENSHITAWHLARHVEGADLARVLRRSPEAAGALFDAVTTTPEVQHGGWHPLPRRVSFAQKHLSLFLMDLVNPKKELLVHYVEDSEWRYDVASFEAPDWHEDFREPTCGTPVHDVQVQICRVPNLLVAEFFSGLADVDLSGELSIFDHSVVKGSISYVWWNGAWRVDVLHAALGLWGLGLLILESWLVGGDIQPPSHAVEPLQVLGNVTEGRGLKAITPSSVNATQHLSGYVPVRGLAGEIAVSAAFIGGKGVIDVVHELAQFAGFILIGRPGSYLCDIGNLWDLFRGMVLMALCFDATNSLIRVMVIFILWMRLLEMFTSAETIAVSILPLKRLPRSLAPALSMMMVAFLAFMHVFHYVWGHNHNWQATFAKAFATLINAELPAKPLQDSGLELFVTYAAVMFFSIFMLNIFIGVIGTAYESEKTRVPQTFLQHRAVCCLNFLLRARVFPGNLCSRLRANIISLVAFAACFLTQAIGLCLKSGGMLVWTIFFLSQLILLLAAYQTPELHWRNDGKNRYLWITRAIGAHGQNTVVCSCGAEFPISVSYCHQCGAIRTVDEPESPSPRRRWGRLPKTPDINKGNQKVVW